MALRDGKHQYSTGEPIPRRRLTEIAMSRANRPKARFALSALTSCVAATILIACGSTGSGSSTGGGGSSAGVGSGEHSSTATGGSTSPGGGGSKGTVQAAQMGESDHRTISVLRIGRGVGASPSRDR